MNNQKINSYAVTDKYSSEFPVSYTETALKKDIFAIYLATSMDIHMISNEGIASKVVGMILEKTNLVLDEREVIDILKHYKKEDSDLPITYEDICKTPLVQAMEEFYRFAYLGIQIEENIPGKYIRTEMIIKRLEMLSEWGIFSNGLLKRCRDMIDLARARDILEQTNVFSIDYQIGGDNQNEKDRTKDALTIRQMALLAGMEEMSIRAAANPNRVERLITFKGEGGRTLVSIEDAKEWLKSKKRYVIVRNGTYKNIDIQSGVFESLDQLADALQKLYMSKLQYIGDDGWEQPYEKEKVLKKLGFEFERNGNDRIIKIERKNLKNKALVGELEKIFNIKKGVLDLKVDAALKREDLARIEKELRDILNHKNEEGV